MVAVSKLAERLRWGLPRFLPMFGLSPGHSSLTDDVESFGLLLLRDTLPLSSLGLMTAGESGGVFARSDPLNLKGPRLGFCCVILYVFGYIVQPSNKLLVDAF
jgi:hypothetical protein